jgi:hypothetical protein
VVFTATGHDASADHLCEMIAPAAGKNEITATKAKY